MSSARLLAVVAAAGCVGVCAGVAPAGAVVPQATGHETVRVIIRADDGATDAAADAVRRVGGELVGVQSALGTLVADVTDPADLAGLPGVGVVSPDLALEPLQLGAESSGQPGSMASVVDTIGARSLWEQGLTGKGIDVAVVDTGVVPVPALMGEDKLVVGPDLSLDSQLGDLQQLDGYGHGTHMAGIIAGREGAAMTGPEYAADTENFYGVAPDARLVSVKVADHAGAVDVSQVIAAIDWVVQNRRSYGLNIRVLNLSYGTPASQDPLVDPLAYAAEVAVRSGIVVVTAAGNAGASKPGLINPAFHPDVIAVGAADTQGTVGVEDDTMTSFSAVAGGAYAPNRTPDLVAPGRSVVSLAVPGGTIAAANPAALVGEDGIKGSGTSQAAAVVSGAVALLLQDRSWMVSMHVKDLLARSAVPLAGVGPEVQGAGELNVAQAAAAFPGWNAETQGTGTGSLETARGGVHLLDGDAPLTGEVDVLGGAWDSARMAGLAKNSGAWTTSSTFNGSEWVGPGWLDGGAPTATWSGKTWTGKTWTGKTWTGKTWSGEAWSGKTWSGKTWTGTTWTGESWGSEVTLSTLAGTIWATEAWE